MLPKLLIVNADDYNTDPERNCGIIEAARCGIVTSASVITNRPWLKDAREDLIKTFAAGTGVHLNLTGGTPLTGDTRTLTGANGRFFPKP
ncbi:MAG: ChbG/HpnK family deacetylase, partial [Deltaproteobacteria bacterium]|nr:ChbG/HpnK family deacetylase [Deltaproteobacteria bacterium]